MGCGKCCAWFGIVSTVALALLLGWRVTIDKSIKPVDLTGKVFVVTGATAGLGMRQARYLARWNATVVVGARNLKKAEDVVAKLLPEAGPNAYIKAHALDLANLQSVRDFATWFTKTYPAGLDCLVNNAGILGGKERKVTGDGIEEVFQANYLGHFVLTMDLLPSLRAAASGHAGEARVVHIASDAHYLTSIDIEDLQCAKPGCYVFNDYLGTHAGSQYARPELMQVAFSNKLQRLLSGTGVVSNSLHPAMSLTSIVDGQPWTNALLTITQAIGLDTTLNLFENPSNDANLQTHVSTHPALGKVGGRYYSITSAPIISCGKRDEDCAMQTPSRQTLNYSLQDRLFEESCKLAGYKSQSECLHGL